MPLAQEHGLSTAVAKFNAAGASASLRTDVIRGSKPAESQHNGQSCHAQPASTHRQSGDSSPAAHTCPGFPVTLPTANLIAEKVMKSKSTKKADSKGNTPGKSNESTASRRGENEHEEEFFKLFPSLPEDIYAPCDGEDVTDEHRESVQRLYDELAQHADKHLRDHIDKDILKKEVGHLLHFLERNRFEDAPVSLIDICAEIAPTLPPRKCFSRLRSAGFLSNRPGDWNQAFGEPVEEGWLQNRHRCFRVSDGSHRGRFVPYVTVAGIAALKQRLIETLTGDENQGSHPTRKLTKGKNK